MAAATRKAARDSREVLTDLLGKEMAERAITLFTNYVRSAEEGWQRQAEYAAQAAANPPQELGGETLGHYDPFMGLQQKVQEEIFVTCISQGAAPDMAWTRCNEAALYYMTKMREAYGSGASGAGGAG